MKKINSLHLPLILIFSLISSCKKDLNANLSKFTYTDDNITAAEIANNYLLLVDGSFTMSNTGINGSIGVSRDLPEFKYLKTSHVLLNGKKLTPTTVAFFDDYVYNYPPSISTPNESIKWQNFFTSIYNETKSNFQLFDTTNNFVVGFIVNNPKVPIISINNQNYREAPAGSRIIVHWNSDASNKLGIAITISGNNGIRYLNFSETGSADITDEAIAVGGNDRVSVTLSRGVIITGKGRDNRIYKFTNVVSKTDNVYI